MAISNFMNHLLLAAGDGHLEYVLRWDSWTSRPFELHCSRWFTQLHGHYTVI